MLPVWIANKYPHIFSSGTFIFNTFYCESVNQFFPKVVSLVNYVSNFSSLIEKQFEKLLYLSVLCQTITLIASSSKKAGSTETATESLLETV